MSVVANTAFCTLLLLLLVHDVIAKVTINEVNAWAGRRLRWSRGGARYGSRGSWRDLDWDDSDPSWEALTIVPNANRFERNHVSNPWYSSFYVRVIFDATAEQANSNADLQFKIDWTDGFIVYINGAEATRKNLGPAGMYGWFDTFAFQARPEAAAEEVFSLGPANARLKAGKNILALQVHRTESVPAIRAKFGLTVNGVGAMLRSDNSKAKAWRGYGEPSGQLIDPVLQKPEAIDPSDWIELYNSDSAEIDIGDWSLTDDEYFPRQWVWEREGDGVGEWEEKKKDKGKEKKKEKKKGKDENE